MNRGLIFKGRNVLEHHNKFKLSERYYFDMFQQLTNKVFSRDYNSRYFIESLKEV